MRFCRCFVATRWSWWTTSDGFAPRSRCSPRLRQEGADVSHSKAKCGNIPRNSSRDPVEAVKLFEKSAASGLAQAQFIAALQYHTGNGVPKDLGRALALYCSAAELGYAPAQANLGHMYEKGEGVAANNASAVDWYARSALRGHVTGQFDLAVMYLHGSGVPQDLARAPELF